MVALVLTLAATWSLQEGDKAPLRQTDSVGEEGTTNWVRGGAATAPGSGPSEGNPGNEPAKTPDVTTSSDGGVYGNAPQKSMALSDLPEGGLKTEILRLPEATQAKALERLAAIGAPENNTQSLHADETGEIFYACEGLKVETAEAETVPTAETAGTPSVPISSPPVRHSRPGASATIYLDFNGEIVSGTAWLSGATRQCIPFDKDGDATTFSGTEQDVIVRVWEAVAEDYLPFNIDVTTEEPAVMTTRTVRVLVTRNTDAAGLANPYSTAGGVAYVGAFDIWGFHTRFSPAFVYHNNVGNTAANIAEAASHEAGHNLGLSHDGTTSLEYYKGHGTGDTSWAPIMGAGYGKNVTQWSKGEYYLANNLQDDVAILNSKIALNGQTSQIEKAPANGTGAGMILASDETDTYTFSTYSLVSVTVAPTKLKETAGGNLDPSATINDESGATVGLLDSGTSTGISSIVRLPAGSYTLKIRGGAVGGPLSSTPNGYTKYGSLGAYTLTLATDEAPYVAWCKTHGLAEDPMDDSENNGIKNIERYAFGIAPRSANQQSKLPTLGTWAQGAAEYLTTTFRKNPSATASYAVEESRDLIHWSAIPLAGSTVATSNNSDGTQNICVRASVPIGEAPQLFLRVAVGL